MVSQVGSRGPAWTRSGLEAGVPHAEVEVSLDHTLHSVQDMVALVHAQDLHRERCLLSSR
jgi:hypothetical protein